MCGLVGILTKAKNGLTFNENKAFQHLLFADTLRGADGTGIFYNERQGKARTKVFKTAYPAPSFMGTKPFQKSMETAVKSSNFLIGHNRAATKGAVDADNAHPFREKHIVLAHNGTLNTFMHLFPAGVDIKVDSNAIAYSIAEIGEEETFKKLNGSYALIWVNTREGTINMFRNYMRPLSLIEFDNGWIVCSEAKMGEWVADRNNLTIKKVEEVDPYNLYTFKISNIGAGYEKRKMSVYTPPAPSTPSYPYPSVYDPYDYDRPDWLDQANSDFGTPIATALEEKTHLRWNNLAQFSMRTDGKIRFRAGQVAHDPMRNTEYLTGDLLSFQGYEAVQATQNNFEKRWRVRYYPPAGVDISRLVDNLNLVGELEGCQMIYQKKVIFVKDVSLYREGTKSKSTPKQTYLPKKTPGPNEAYCNFCTAIINKEDGVTLEDNSFLCEGCAGKLRLPTIH